MTVSTAAGDEHPQSPVKGIYIARPHRAPATASHPLGETAKIWVHPLHCITPDSLAIAVCSGGVYFLEPVLLPHVACTWAHFQGWCLHPYCNDSRIFGGGTKVIRHIVQGKRKLEENIDLDGGP